MTDSEPNSTAETDEALIRIAARLTVLETSLELLLANVCMASSDPEAKTLAIIDDIERKLRAGIDQKSGSAVANIEPFLERRLNSLKSTVSDMVRELAASDR